MKEFYCITVPTTIYNRPASVELVDAIRSLVKVSLAKAFGGCTEVSGLGSYLSASGELIEEPIFKIEAFFEQADDDLIFGLASEIKAKMSQESVLVNKNNEVYFV